MILFFILSAAASEFDGELAYQRLKKTVQTGHRYYGAANRKQAIAQIKSEFDCDVWIVQEFRVEEPVSNITYTLENHICRIAPELSERIILGSHFDTRLWAEEDKDTPNKPIPGANDGSSGVVVLMGISDLVEQAKTAKQPKMGLDLILFDGEEFGRPQLGNYCVGSRHFAQHIDTLYSEKLPSKAIVLDMVADADLIFRPESRSQMRFPDLYDEIWSIGKQLSPDQFGDRPWGAINDDHTPLMKSNIPSALLIDMDYPYWHTQQDTLDKCSVESLTLTGSLIWAWLSPQMFFEKQ